MNQGMAMASDLLGMDVAELFAQLAQRAAGTGPNGSEPALVTSAVGPRADTVDGEPSPGSDG